MKHGAGLETSFQPNRFAAVSINRFVFWSPLHPCVRVTLGPGDRVAGHAFIPKRYNIAHNTTARGARNNCILKRVTCIHTYTLDATWNYLPRRGIKALGNERKNFVFHCDKLEHVSII